MSAARECRNIDNPSQSLPLGKVRNKARYGHKSILYWKNEKGDSFYSQYNKRGVKAAILSVGAKGRFYWFDGSGNSNIAYGLSYMIHLWRCA